MSPISLQTHFTYGINRQTDSNFIDTKSNKKIFTICGVPYTLTSIKALMDKNSRKLILVHIPIRSNFVDFGYLYNLKISNSPYQKSSHAHI